MFRELEEEIDNEPLIFYVRYLLGNEPRIVFRELEEEINNEPLIFYVRYLLGNEPRIVFRELEEEINNEPLIFYVRYLLGYKPWIVFRELEEEINNEPLIFYVVTIACGTMKMTRTVTCKYNHTFRLKINFSVKMLIFSYPSIFTYILGAQKNHLIDTVLLSTHNICFG